MREINDLIFYISGHLPDDIWLFQFKNSHPRKVKMTRTSSVKARITFLAKKSVFTTNERRKYQFNRCDVIDVLFMLSKKATVKEQNVVYLCLPVAHF